MLTQILRNVRENERTSVVLSSHFHQDFGKS
jgi:hypothetical protein